jgi:glycine dehydrogenase subunit 1
MHNFLAHTEADRKKMWAAIGIQSTGELFEDIPKSLRESIQYKHLPQHGLSELELEQVMRGLARKNTGHQMACFLGGGAYARYVPPAVNTIASRSEFYTAYTPYQPEISQGTLQVIYEFQTMIAELTGLDAANASVYDGATAVAEAAMMALRIAKKSNLIYVSKGLNPDYQDVLETYLSAVEPLLFKTIDPLSESFSEKILEDGLAGEKPAAVIIQVPDYYGIYRVWKKSRLSETFALNPVHCLLLQPNPFL